MKVVHLLQTFCAALVMMLWVSSAEVYLIDAYGVLVSIVSELVLGFDAVHQWQMMLSRDSERKRSLTDFRAHRMHRLWRLLQQRKSIIYQLC